MLCISNELVKLVINDLNVAVGGVGTGGLGAQTSVKDFGLGNGGKGE